MHRIAFIILCLLSQGFHAQEITVLDRETRDPIINVAIYNTDKSRTALTDFQGKANLDVFGEEERITFKHISYEVRRLTKTMIRKRGGVIPLLLRAEELDEVVMSVSKWEQQRKDVPQKIATVNARKISFDNPQTSADLLRNSGKVFVQKSQLGGGSPMIRGFATNRLLLTVDGVRMNNAIFRGGNIQNVISIDPFALRNTEIIFGPGSVIYGSDAIGGVMNFYTKKPEFADADSLFTKGSVNYRYGSANTENTLHADINLGRRKWAFLTSVSYNDFGDLKMGSRGPEEYLRRSFVTRSNGRDRVVANQNPREQVPTGYDQLSLMQKITHRPNNIWDHELGLHYSATSDYARYDRLIRPGGSEGFRSAEWYYGPQRWFMGNLRTTKRGRGKFYDAVKLTTTYQHFEESRHDRNFGEALRFSTEEKVDAFSTSIDFENRRTGDFRLYYGSNYVYNKVHSEGSQANIVNGATDQAASRYPDGASWQTLAGYANVEYRAKPNFTMLAGLRYSHVWVDAVFDETFYAFPFKEADLSTGALTGSLGFSWFPTVQLQVTLNGSTGFRAPNIDDIGKIFDSEPGSVVVPNPNLEPEYAYNIDLGIQKNFDDRLVWKSSAFYTYLVDALVRRDFTFNGQRQIDYKGELSDVLAIQNAARAYVYGLELGLEAFLSDNVSVNGNLTLTKGVEEDEDGTDYPARHAAPTFGDFHLVYKNQRIHADLFAEFNGTIAAGDLAPSERVKDYIYAIDTEGNPYSPSWYTLNLRTQYTISEAVNVTLGLENLTDQRYRPYSSGIAAAGINFVGGLGYRF